MANANGRTQIVGPSFPTNDFYKTNGLDRSVHEVMPGGASLTRQEFAEECDINTLMKKYEAVGMSVNQLKNDRPPMYVDWTDMPQDLQGFMQLQHEAELAFMTLPAAVRREFDNDPIAFVNFAIDPNNIDQMRDWELAAPLEPVQPGPALSPGVRNPAVAVPAPGAPGAGQVPPAPPAAPGGVATHGST